MGDICRNTDKISFGNLEIYTNTDARPSSAQVRKILSRPSSHEVKKSLKQRSSDQPHKTPVDIHQQQDRELFSEKSFDVSESEDGEETDKKDAEVQTPTRLKQQRRQSSPRLRTSPKHKSTRAAKKASKMSLISTESEEAVDFTNLPFASSSEEINPIGRIRKRFHQFLDDAFNVMGMYII
jgi:hypothetical protein